MFSIARTVIFYCFFLFTNFAFSEDENFDFLDLTLEQLMQIEVTVASHKSEKIIATPAIVSRYNIDEMKSLGLRNLTDILSFIPGITIQDNVSGQPFISMRGIYEGFNQKVLLLLDDTPYFMPSHSDIPLLGIPLDSISHIEVIRGPGSVYYGTNATAGVIKIITKKNSTSSASLQVGENNYANFNGIYQGNRALHHWQISTELQRDNGYNAVYPEYQRNNTYFAPGSIDKRKETSSILMKYWHDGNRFSITGQAFESTYIGLDGAQQVNNINTLTYSELTAA